MFDAPRRIATTICLGLLIVAGVVSTPPAAGATEPVVLWGQVTDEGGQPIEGATASAYPARSNHQQGVDRLAGVEPGVAVESSTNSRGTFFLRVEPGAYQVLVAAEGRAERHIDLLPVAETFRLEPISLPEKATFRLRVLQADGSPAVDARVAAQGDDGSYRPTEWHPALQHVRTDDHGVADLDVGQGRKIDVRVIGADGSFFYQDGLTGSSADVTLDPGTEWTLRTEDPRGRALEGVVVHLTAARIAVGRTDEHGEFRLRLDENPPVTLRLSHEDGYYLRTAVADDPADETKRHVFTLGDPEVISGRVVAGHTGEAIAGALVWPAGLSAYATLTDRSGGFSLTPLPGIEWFQAAAQGYGEGHVDLRGEAEIAREVTIRLPPITRITGRVMGPDGRGIDRVELTATIIPGRARISSTGVREVGQSQEEGRFVIDRVHPGMTYEVETRRDGFARARERVTTLRPPEVVEVELVLEPGIQAVGRVVDQSDQPISGATVELHPPPEDPSMGRISYSFSGEPDFASGTSGETGDFTVPDMGPGTYRIEVRRTGFAQAVVPGVEIDGELVLETVTDSGDTRREADLGTIVLVPGVELVGRVIDSDDKPISGAEILATPVGGSRSFGPRRQDTLLKITTGADGIFRFADLTAGESIRLDLKHDGYSGLQLHGVEPPTEEPLEIVMERAAVIRGRIIDENRAPVAKVSILAHSEQPGRSTSGYAHGRTDESGSFEILGMSPGKMQLQVDDRGWRTKVPLRIEVAAGEVAEGVEVQVARGLILNGTVRDADGHPVSEAQVSAKWTSAGSPVQRGMFTNSTQTDIHGRFELGMAAEGEVKLTAYHSDYGHAEKTLDLRTPGADVDLVLEAGIDVTGLVTTPEGDPAAGAIVTLQTDPGASPEMAMSFQSNSVPVDGNGRFRFAAVADGTYHLVADHPDYSQYRSESLEIAGASVAEQLIQLERGATVRGELLGLEFEQLGNAQVSAFSSLGVRRLGVVRHDGTYRLNAMAAGTWYVQAQVGDQSRSGQLVLEEGQTEATLDFDFGSGYELEGSVRLDGERLAGANVMLNSLSDPGLNRRGKTNFEGEFRLGGLSDGRHTFHVFSGDGFQHLETLDIPYPGTLDIHVRTSSIAGVVRSTEGPALAGASVSAQSMAENDPADGMVAFLRLSGQRQATTDATGAYQLPRLPEGTWKLTASQDGFAPSEITTQILQGADQLGADFALRPVQGLWLDLVPTPGVTLTPTARVATMDLTGNHHSTVQTVIEEGGAIHLSTLPEGSWRLAVSVPGAGTAYLTAQAPGDRPTVSLLPEAKLKLESPDFDSVAGFLQATVTRSDGFVHQALLGNHLLPTWPIMPMNHREIHGLPPGTWTVEVAHPDGGILRGTATVQAGEIVTLDLVR